MYIYLIRNLFFGSFPFFYYLCTFIAKICFINNKYL